MTAVKAAESVNPYLDGFLAPVRAEVTATDLPVTGHIPEHLDGRYLRNGPNPVAEVDPASVSHTEALLSARFMLNMSAALAVSLDENDMPRYASMICLPSIFFMSMCLIGCFNSSLLVVFVFAILLFLLYRAEPR